MELEKFVTTVIKAIGKGIREGTEEGNFEPGYPSGSQNPGVEFDLGVNEKDDKIEVVDRYNKDIPVASRIKFTIPIYGR